MTTRRKDKRAVLRDAGELARHIWRVRDDDRPAYMRAINRLLAQITGVVVALMLALPLGAQGTKADTALTLRVRLTVTDSLRIEANRRQGARKSVILRLATRDDSLMVAHLKPTTPPPDTTTPPPDSVPPDTVVVPPPGDSVSIAKAPELPRSVPEFQIPPPTRIVSVPAPGMMRSILSTITFGLVDGPGDLQAALDQAQPGDEIRLSAEGKYTGNYTFSSCHGDWITITSDAAIPSQGVRVTPSSAAKFAKIVSANHEPALRTLGPACRLRIVGVEIVGEFESTQFLAYGIIRLGQGGDDGQTSLDRVPTNFVLERVYIHGTALHNNARCVVLNSGATIVRDSWVSDCHARGSDSQAILGWNGPGPYLIENNHLAGAGENIMFGGADPGIFGLIPSDITIRRNHIVKPLSWRGGPWSIKNLLELKNAQRTDLDANVLENSWPASQEGMALVFKSSKDACTSCDWQGTVDLTVRWNIIRTAAVGLNLQARDGPTTLPIARVAVTQNLFEKIGAEGRAALMLLTHDLADVSITFNTFAHDPTVGTSRGGAMITDYANGAARRMEWIGNLMGHGAYGFFYNGAIGTAALNAMIADGSWRMTGNTIVGATDLASKYPPGNTWLTTWPTEAGIGVDMAELQRRTAGVVVAP